MAGLVDDDDELLELDTPVEAVEEEAVAEPVPHAGTPGMLRDRFTVRSNQPLPDLSMPNAEAFAAEDRRDPNRKLFALICKPEVAIRSSVMRTLKGLKTVGIQPLVDWGPMTWPPAGRQCMTVLYDRPVGRRVMADMHSEIRRIDEYDITRKVVTPLVNAIKELVRCGVTHRAIRPTNLFYMDEAGERLAFGDCVTSPPAFDQPMVCETIESAMSSPIGRGGGTYADDLYSLGVTMAFLLLGRNPVAHLDDETILRAKIAQGSYSLLVADERLPLPMIEVLRGLLCDDGMQRWDIETLDLWQQGRRMSPLQPRVEKRASRSFPFQGKEYYNCRELAVALSKNWDAAIPLVLEGKLELWLSRAIEDKERAAAVAEVVRLTVAAAADKRMGSDLLLCKVLILLDPSAPIRYKGFSAMPDGFGAALAAVMAARSDTKLIAEIILREVPKLWFEAQGQYQPDNSLMEANFRELRSYLTTQGMGFGLERCLYEMNDSLPCQSSLMGEEYVTELRELLPGLNTAAANSKRADGKQWPCDRHVAAFMGARARSDIDRNLMALNDSDAGKALMSLLNLFAVFQYRLGPESLTNLAAWFETLLGPVIGVYHSREKRKELEKEIPKLVRKGSVVEMYNLLDDPGSRHTDHSNFVWAKAQYQAAEEEIRRVQADEDERETDADRIGKQTASVIGILIALLTITVVVILTVW